MRVHPQLQRGCSSRRRVVRGAALVALLVLAAWPQAAAQDAGLEASLRPVSTSLEAGKPYLIGFVVRYPCGPSRTIHLEASGPEWAESAVTPNFRTRSERCLEGFRGEFTESILVDVYQDAVEGTAGNLTLTALDGDTTVVASVALKVRQVTPRAEVRPLDAPLTLDAGDTITFDLTTVYTSWKPGRIRWIAQGPPDWGLSVPAARATENGEGITIVAPFAATAPPTANGTVLLDVHAVLLNRTGARVAESPVTSIPVVVSILPVEGDDGPLDPAGEEVPEVPKTVPPRPSMWLLGSIVLVAMVGIYALESREERRKP